MQQNQGDSKFTVTVPAKDGKVASEVAYRHRQMPARLFTPDAATPTLYANFELGLSRSRNRPCLGWRPSSASAPAQNYQWMTYQQVADRRTWFGSGLVPILADNQQSSKTKIMPHVGIYAVNRPEWVICEQACNAYSLVTVALYDTLGADTLEFTVNHAELSVVCCSWDRLPALLRVSKRCPVLRTVICMDPLPENDRATKILRQWAAECQLQLLTFTEVEERGRAKPLAHRPPRPDDICTICYTSGTTGNPKGAMLMHKNFVASALSFPYHGLPLAQEDVMISYLPLAHCFERVLHVAMYHVGGSIGFYRGDVLLLVEDIAALRPTIFPSVPRLFNRIYDKLVVGTTKAPGLRGTLFRRAYAAKLERLKQPGGGLTHWFWDRLLFSKVAAVLGGRVRVMITGSAPISGDVLTFLRLCFSCEILEGYGQTECAAGSTITFPGDYATQQVGCPLVCNEIKLVDVPDMNYRTTDRPRPRGEVCIRGTNVMTGYYKDPEKTRETIDEEGWLHTGDIGMITDTGNLAIIDRKKNIFKLAQGEYIAPEKLENIFTKSVFIMQCFVHGDSLQAELVTVVVPDPEHVVPWARKKGLLKSDKIQELSGSAELKRLIMEEIHKMAKKFKLAGFEIPKRVHIEFEQFTVENDLLTPTFKLKRQVAQSKYQREIAQMYQQLQQEREQSQLSASSKL